MIPGQETIAHAATKSSNVTAKDLACYDDWRFCMSQWIHGIAKQTNKYYKNKKKTYMITDMKSDKYQVKQFSCYCELSQKQIIFSWGE